MIPEFDTLNKASFTRFVRDTAVSAMAEESHIRRTNNANAVLSFDEVYVCLNVQHNKYKTEGVFHFALNIGLQPKVVFEANLYGLEGAHPAAFNSIFRTRLRLAPRVDQWWRVSDQVSFIVAINEIRLAADLCWREFVEPRMLLENCFELLPDKSVRGTIYHKAGNVMRIALERD